VDFAKQNPPYAKSVKSRKENIKLIQQKVGLAAKTK
jgi:hypothetical protein